jgi:hypothetical protein
MSDPRFWTELSEDHSRRFLLRFKAKPGPMLDMLEALLFDQPKGLRMKEIHCNRRGVVGTGKSGATFQLETEWEVLDSHEHRLIAARRLKEFCEHEWALILSAESLTDSPPPPTAAA